MTSDEQKDPSRTYDDWEFVFTALAISDETLQDMIEHHREALAMVMALWEARCKTRAKHKRFTTLWNSLDNEETSNDGPTLGTKARLVWDYLRKQETADPDEIAAAIGLEKRNVQSVLASRRELFHYDETGWRLAEVEHTQTTESIETTVQRSIATVSTQGSTSDRNNMDEIRTRIHDHLSKVGVQKPATIAADVGLSLSVVKALVDHEWFQKTPDGYSVA